MNIDIVLKFFGAQEAFLGIYDFSDVDALTSLHSYLIIP